MQNGIHHISFSIENYIQMMLNVLIVYLAIIIHTNLSLSSANVIIFVSIGAQANDLFVKDTHAQTTER